MESSLAARSPPRIQISENYLSTPLMSRPIRAEGKAFLRTRDHFAG